MPFSVIVIFIIIDFTVGISSGNGRGVSFGALIHWIYWQYLVLSETIQMSVIVSMSCLHLYAGMHMCL